MGTSRRWLPNTLSERRGMLCCQYAYQHRLLGGKISAGIQAGMVSENFDGSKVDVVDPDDPAFSSSSENGTGLDL